MIGIYLLMTAHVLHWWITGRSVGRLVLSDSMETLELGRVNPGFVLFCVALLVTAVFGRFMCGWACHMAGLQDLCAWIMRKVGVRPRLFRSRVLGYAPLGLAVYMFIWPTFKRELLTPLLRSAWPEALVWIGPTPQFPGFTASFTTTQLWTGLPSWAVAVPFLLLCGFGTVYFLGARGLCRYGCPYGGFFLPLEQLAPGRVVVDAASCDQCGLCTAACTAQVRVHDEVRVHGMVTDRNCVRSLDCVAICPRGALSFRFTRPAIFRRRPSAEDAPRPRYDLSLPEEVAAGVVFLLSFLILRGLYDRIPMLMAATMAAVAAFVGWKSVRLMKDRDVRFSGAQLRRAGRLTVSGKVFLGVTTIAGVMLAHSGLVRAMILAGELADDRVRVGLSDVLSDQGVRVPTEDRANAAAALRWYGRGLSFSRGGCALADTPSVVGRLPWLRLVVGDREGAKAELRAAGLGDANASSLARILLSENNVAEAERVLMELVGRDPGAFNSRDLIAEVWLRTGRLADAERLFAEAMASDAKDRRARLGMGRLKLAAGDPEGAAEHLAAAVRESPTDAAARSDLAAALVYGGRPDDGLRVLESGIELTPAFRSHFVSVGSALLRQVGMTRRAAEWEQQHGVGGR